MTFDFPPQKGSGLENQLLGFNLTKECMDLMKSLLTYDPKDRISSDEALKHPFFKDYTDANINFGDLQLSSVLILFSNKFYDVDFLYKMLGGHFLVLLYINCILCGKFINYLVLRYKSTSTMRKQNQQSMPENLDKFANSLIKVDSNIQKSEIAFAPENMFFPVLGIKKTINQYQKKMIKKKTNFLKLNGKNEMYKSHHFKNCSDNELAMKINKKYLNPRNQVTQIFYKFIISFIDVSTNQANILP